MKQIGIFTDFISHDPAYSLCTVVRNMVKMLTIQGYQVTLFTQTGFQDHEAYEPAKVVCLEHGETGNNTVEITADTDNDIQRLERQMLTHFAGLFCILSLDLIYQPNMWKAHVAARRVTKQLPDLRWLHWVCSATDMRTATKTGRYRNELHGRFPKSLLVAHNQEEMKRKGGLYGYELDQMVVIPMGHDFTECYHPMALELIEQGELWDADIIAVYPCRLDRGKQPHILIEIFEGLIKKGYNAKIVLVDFHSTGGDKKAYRQQMKRNAIKANVPIIFSSDMRDGAYHVPHKAVTDMFNFGDVLIHPSQSESDPMIIPEALWNGCGLVLNFDLPIFRAYDGRALLYKFSSQIDVTTGQPGETKTEYGNRKAYMMEVAGAIAYQMENNPILYHHAMMRKTRSLTAVSRLLWQAIEGASQTLGNIY